MQREKVSVARAIVAKLNSNFNYNINWVEHSIIFVLSTHPTHPDKYWKSTSTITKTSTKVEISINFVLSDHPPGLVVMDIEMDAELNISKLNSNFNYNFNLSWE